MNQSSYRERAIQTSCYISFDIDFYCKFSISKVTEKFSQILKEKIEIVDEDNFKPDKNKFYIVKTYGMGKERYRFYTDNLIYAKARIVLISAFGVIKEFGYTDSSCISEFSISFDKKISGIDLRKIDVLKFVLSFNEEMIYRFFPNQKDSIYVKSIKNLLPANKFYRSENSSTSTFDYILPNMKFYGVIFDDIKDGVIHFRYVGGEKYEYEVLKALDVIGLCIEQIISVCFEPSYTTKDKDTLKKLIKGSDRILEAYESSTKFKEKYPKIKLTVDLDDNLQMVKSKYVKFRDDIFDLLANSDITEGEINYDSALSKIQAKDMKGHIYEIEGWEFVNCELTLGYAENCNFFECGINNSSLNRCNIYRYCTVKNCKIKDTYINRTCVVDDSFIHGDISTIDGKINRGKIIGGRIGNHSIISPETEKLDYTKIYTK